MKHQILIVITSLLSFVTYGQTVLQGRINNLQKGKVYLQNTTTRDIDTVEIKNHAFIYTEKLTEQTLFYMSVDGYNDLEYPMKLVLSNETTSVTIQELKAVKMGGHWKKLYPNTPFFSRDPNFNNQLVDFETAFIIFSDSISKLDSPSLDPGISLSKRKALYGKFIESVYQFMKSNPTKIMTAVILHEYIIRNRMVEANEAKTLFLQLDDNVRYSAMGITIGTYLDKEFSVKVGEPAPYFEFNDIHGKEYNLNQFKNKTLVLHFWSSTCGPCRVQNKELVNFNQKNTIVVNVSLDGKEVPWKKAIEKDGLSNMINGRDVTGKIGQDYNVHGIPIYYIIDGNGRISGKGLEEIKN